jgi:hypothetical protein
MFCNYLQDIICIICPSLFVLLFTSGVTKRCRLSWPTTCALVYWMIPNARGWGGGREGVAGSQPMSTEPVFVDLLRIPGIDSQPGGTVRQTVCRTGLPGDIDWWNRFLGINSWAP